MKAASGLRSRLKKLRRIIKNSYYIVRVANKQKIFCIGMNKTGTSSLRRAMIELGYTVGDQNEGELLFNDWVRRDFKKLYKYCRTAEFFQDIPFSYPYTFIAVDQHFPGSKFILTVRDNADQWYNSLINFLSKLFGDGRIPPSLEDMKSASYIYKGFAYDTIKKVMNVPDEDLFNKVILTESYNNHIETVTNYFKERKSDLLILNVGEENAYKKLCDFLNKDARVLDFPWENKT